MDFSSSKLELLDKFKEDDSEIEELSRIEEFELLQSPKFKRLQSLSPSKSSPPSPTRNRSSSIANNTSKNNENTNLFDSIPRLNYRSSNPLLKTPTKSRRGVPLKPLNKHVPLNFNATSPSIVKSNNKVSLTPAQRLEKKPGKLFSTTDILASYDFKETVGRGAFANVYRAVNKITGDEVAIKEIFIEDDDDILELMSEIDLLKILKHKNIVKYHGFIRNEKKLLIFLEYCSGGSLRTLYKKSGPLSEKSVIRLLLQVLNGLIYLHNQGVVHRDVKAANILLTDKGDVKLTDFGVSTKVSNNTIKTFSIAGTPNWMAPEIISMDGTSTASDIWSLGATVVELLTGEPLYCHLNEMAALHAIVMDSSPPIPHFISPECKDFLHKCFEKVPSKRITATELLEHPWLKGVQIQSDVIGFRHSLGRKNNIEIEREFSSIKKFNTKKFSPLEVNTLKHTEISAFIENEFSDELNELILEDQAEFSTSKFDPIGISNDEFDILKEQLFEDPFNSKVLCELHVLLDSEKLLAQRCFKENFIFKILQWIEVKYNSDSELLLKYLMVLNTIINKAEKAAQELVDLSGLPLISKFLHKKYEKSVRLETIDILNFLFSKNDSYICLFIQAGCLKVALKLLQEDYKDEKQFILFIINILYVAFTKPLMSQNVLQSLLSTYTNFMDWMAVVLLQLVNFKDQEAINKVIEIVSTFQNSKILTIRPIFLNSIFKLFDKLDLQNQLKIIIFLKSINVSDIPENVHFLKFLVKTLKKCTISKPINNAMLNMICAMIYSICHLNHEQQYELVKLDALPVLQDFVSSMLPCSEFIIPLFCEFSFNGKVVPVLLKEENGILQDYLNLLIDNIWQANALDSILALHDISNNDTIAELLHRDGSKLLIHSFLVDDTLNYELYLEKLIRFLNYYSRSMIVNQIRLDFFQDSDVITAIFKRIKKYDSDLVIHINLLKLLKLLVINNYDEPNYEFVIRNIKNAKKSGTLLVDQLVQEILEMEQNKEKSMMRPPLSFTPSTPHLRMSNINNP